MMANLLKKLIGGGTYGENRLAENVLDLTAPTSSKMSNNNQSSRVLSFHSVHGEKIRLSKQGRLAKRYDTFCQGLTFSSRPIDLDEIVVLKIAETTGRWSGVLRFGVTNVDPQTLKNNFPKYACPDMSSKGNTWAKALSERFCKQGNIINFYVRPNGEMYYGVNGVQKGLYLSSINVSEPLWVVIDIYGNTVAIEFMDPSEVPLMRQVITQPPDSGSSSPAQVTVGKNLAPAIRPCSVQSGNNQQNPGGQSNVRELSTTTVPPPPAFSVAPSSNDFLPARPRNEEEQRAFATAQCALEFNERLGRRAANAPQTTSSLPPTARSFYPPLKFNNCCDIRPLELHEICGKNIKISNDKVLATRTEGEYANGYIFMKRPLKVNEKIIVQVLRVVPQFSGSLAFGVTSCDPIRLGGPTNIFPDDADYLMDRSEYWVVAKDVASNPQELDELAFFVNDRGEVHLQKNASTPRIIFHVDHSQKLWLFFDVFGTTQQIRLVGGTDVTTVNTSNIVPMTGDEVRRVNLPSENQPIVSQTFHNQNFTQTQPLHVQLPPSGPYLVPTTSAATTSSSSFPPPWSPPQPSPPMSTYVQIPAGQSTQAANAIPPPQLSRRPLRMPPSNNNNNGNNGIQVHVPPPPPVRFSRRAPPPAAYNNQPHGSRPSVPFQGFPPSQQHNAYFQPYQQQQSNPQQHPFAQQAPNFAGPVAFQQQNHRRSSPYFSPLHTPPYNSSGFNSQPNFVSESRLSPVPGNSNNADRDFNFRSRASPVPNAASFPRVFSDQFTNLSVSSQPPQTTQRQADAAESSQSSSKEGENGGGGESHDECVICMNEKPDCVLYTCGHLCMCFACAQTTWQQHKVCPICRKEIKDVIKLYKSVA